MAFPSCFITPSLVSQHLLNNNQMQQIQKIQKKQNGRDHHMKDKRESQRKAKKMTSP
jgi:hypothetical protein